MTAMMYFLQVIGYTAAMLLIYILFLRNRPLHTISRYYLLSCAVLPMLLPFVHLPGAMQLQIQSAASAAFYLPEYTVGSMAAALPVTVASLPTWLYFLPALFLITRQFAGAFGIWRAISRGAKERRDGYTLITNSGYGPCSFGSYIFFPQAEVNETILAHEQAHLHLHHSRDILFICIVRALAWPNFLLGWIIKEIKQVHEFQADSLAAGSKEDYARLLLCSVFDTPSVSIVHSFITHPLKRRIIMFSKKSGMASPLKATVTVAAGLCAVITLGLCAQSCSKKVPQSTATAATQPIKYDTMKVEKTPYVMASYPGGQDAMISYMGHSLKYPEHARAKGVEGRVIVKFVVTDAGYVVAPEVVKSPDTSLSRAALELVSKMPKWEPARMKDGTKVCVPFYLPVLFKLEG